MADQARVGVVTVTYNSAPVLPDFMQSMLRQDYGNFLLYIVDNASSDDTLRCLSQYEDERIVVLRNPENSGVAEGNNIGIRAALRDGCSLVLLINNDTAFGPSLVSELSSGMHQHECEMVVPKILYFDAPTIIWSAGGYLSWIRGSARHFGFDEKDNGKFDRDREINYNPTCCMLIKREVFERVGLMDAKYFVYFDDTDFCLRAHRAGMRLFYVAKAKLFHKVGKLTGGSESLFTIRYCTRNHVYYLLKHFTKWQAWGLLGAFQVHIAVKYLLIGRRANVFILAQRAFREGLDMSYAPQNLAMNSHASEF